MSRFLLDPANRSLIGQCAWSMVLVAFDFDGTLAPIVEDPGQVEMLPRTRTLLAEVARRYPCAVISGRERADLAARLQGIPLVALVGNHGADLVPLARSQLQLLRFWHGQLTRQLASFRGVQVEDKGASLAVHYRRSREKKQVRAALQEITAGLAGLRLIWGKQVLNLLPAGAPHKGAALETLRSRHGCDTALYVGDDDTDEDVFMLDQPGRLLTVRVEEREDSAAQYFLRDQAEIDLLLEALLDARRGPDDHRRPGP